MPEADPPPADLYGPSLDAIAARATRAAPVANWDPPFCGDSGIRIAADGGWWHAGAPIDRPAMVRLFASVLRRDPEGYRLVTPAEKLAIAVDDLPFVAVECRSEGAGPHRRLAFRLGTGDMVVAGPERPLLWEDGRLALGLWNDLRARIARPVYYELATLALDEATNPLGLWSDGVFFAMGPA